ncbi:MAG: LPS assembly lipoprotein LptE [Candidatus Zixiibacteriota bacterium]
MAHRALALSLIAALLLASCSPYSFSGGRTALVESVAVPIFGNDTAEFGLAEALTEGIINGFVADNQVKVVDQGSAQAVLNGKVVEYQRKAYTFDENDQVQEYIVEIYVDADLVKADGSGAVWSAPRMRGFGVYAADSAETVGQRGAIAKITEDIINRTIKSW